MKSTIYILMIGCLVLPGAGTVTKDAQGTFEDWKKLLGSDEAVQYQIDLEHLVPQTQGTSITVTESGGAEDTPPPVKTKAELVKELIDLGEQRTASQLKKLNNGQLQEAINILRAQAAPAVELDVDPNDATGGDDDETDTGDGDFTE